MPKSYDDRSEKALKKDKSARHNRHGSDASPEPARRSRRSDRSSSSESPVRSGRRGRRSPSPSVYTARDSNNKISNRRGRAESPAQSDHFSSRSTQGSAASSDVSSLAYSDGSFEYASSTASSVADGEEHEHDIRLHRTKTKGKKGRITIDEWYDETLVDPSAEGEEVFQKLIKAKIEKIKAQNAKSEAYNAKIPAKNAAIRAKNAKREQQGRPAYGRDYSNISLQSLHSADTNVTVEAYAPKGDNTMRFTGNPKTPVAFGIKHRSKRVAKDGEYFMRTDVESKPIKAKYLMEMFMDAMPQYDWEPIEEPRPEQRKSKKDVNERSGRKESQPKHMRARSRGGADVKRKPMEH